MSVQSPSDQIGARWNTVLERMAGTWRRLLSGLAVRKPNAALAWWRQMPFWNVNLWHRMPMADRVNLGLGGTLSCGVLILVLFWMLFLEY